MPGVSVPMPGVVVPGWVRVLGEPMLEPEPPVCGLACGAGSIGSGTRGCAGDGCIGEGCGNGRLGS
jgi:hypothetical protein